MNSLPGNIRVQAVTRIRGILLSIAIVTAILPTLTGCAVMAIGACPSIPHDNVGDTYQVVGELYAVGDDLTPATGTHVKQLESLARALGQQFLTIDPGTQMKMVAKEKHDQSSFINSVCVYYTIYLEATSGKYTGQKFLASKLIHGRTFGSSGKEDGQEILKQLSRSEGQKHSRK